MYQHYNYGIILIQKGASVHPLTFREDPDRIKKMWEAAEKAKKALYKTEKKGGSKVKQGKGDADEDMEEDSESSVAAKFAKHTVKKHQGMFNNQANVHMQYYDEDDDSDEDEDEESEDEDDLHQENIFNQQNAFGQTVFQQKQPRNAFNHRFGFGGYGGIQ